MKRVVLDGLPLQVRSAGIATYTAGLVRTVAALAPDVEFVLLGMLPAGLKILRAQAAAEQLLLDRPANLRHWGSLLFPFVMGYPAPGARLLALESVVGKCDVFHGTNYALPRGCRARRVVTIHDLALLRSPQLGTDALSRFVRRTARSAAEADGIIADSESTRRDLIELLGLPAQKLRVIYPGFDPAFQVLPEEAARDRVCQRFGLSGPYILHVGTLEPRKNLEMLVKAYARLRRERQIPHRLVLVGARGWKYESLFHCIDRLDSPDAVCYLGPVPASDLPALYNAAELFVYPSLYEGFGLPPLEALACGTPVVTSNISSLPEVVGDAACLVDPSDEPGLASAIAGILGDAELRRRMRERGLAQARRFSWERCARETLALYRELVGA